MKKTIAVVNQRLINHETCFNLVEKKCKKGKMVV